MASQKLDHNPGAHCLTAADLLDRYLNFLKTSQGLADATVVLRRLHVGPFLQSVEKQGTLSDLRRLAPSVVHDYIIEISQQVLDPCHRDAVLKLKRRAFHATPAGRLEQAVPESKTLLDLAFAQGESAGSQTAQLLKLLEEYGPAALRRAIVEALQRHTPRASSVAFLLRRQGRAPRVALDLSGHPEAQSIDVRPHDLETYDELARTQDDDPEP